MEESYLSDFFEEAYWLQNGQFYLERHEGNLVRLGKLFPEIPEVIRDQLYRFAIALGSFIEPVACRIKEGEVSFEGGLDEVMVTYRYVRKNMVRGLLDHLLINKYEHDYRTA